MSQIPDYHIDKLAEILHTLGCEKIHAERMEDTFNRTPNTCYWYCEGMFPPAEQSCKNEWRKEAASLCTKYEMPPQEMIRFIYQYLEMRRKLDDLKTKYSAKAVEDLAPLLLRGVLY